MEDEDNNDELNTIIKSIDNIEKKLKENHDIVDQQIKEVGKSSTEINNAIKKLEDTHQELANRLIDLEQSNSSNGDDLDKNESVGIQFTKSDSYSNYTSGQTNKSRFLCKNTVIGSNVTVAPDRSPIIVGGAFKPLRMEEFLPSVGTTSNAIEYTREKLFTNHASERAEGVQKPESDIEFELVSLPITTIPHFIKISKQLASDNMALASYINARMIYGVNLRVDLQLIAGSGVAPEINGLLGGTSNYVAHGYSAADLGSVLPEAVLIRKIIADCYNAGYPADAILLNPADWANIEIELLTTNAGQVPLNYAANGVPMMWGLPVIQASAMTKGKLLVGAFAQACMIHQREGVTIQLSDSDGDNFTTNLITILAERRMNLAVERPSAIRGGLLSPAARHGERSEGA